MEALPLLSGTFDLFPLAEVLGLIERTAASGALMVRGREVDGALFFASGELVAGEVADLAGPVEGRDALETRVLEVCVTLLRSREAEFDFRPDAAPPWPAAIMIPVGPVLERAAVIAREWPAIMTAVESFESRLERTGSISVPSVTLTAVGFQVLELVDGTATIREISHRIGASLIVVAPEVRNLILAGAIRVVVDAARALATARAGAIDTVLHDGVLDVTGTDPGPPSAGIAPPDPGPVPAAPEPRPTSVPNPVASGGGAPDLRASTSGIETLHPTTDREELARERADLASRAGLSDPGPVPDAGSGAPTPDAPDRAQIVVDRSDLLRMFSGLKDD
ncbi:MAG: DUF4388 domain-containing protein [Acidimicrobiia bacterium]